MPAFRCALAYFFFNYPTVVAARVSTIPEHSDDLLSFHNRFLIDMSLRPKIALYFDVVSPWSRIAYTVLRRYKQPWNLDLVMFSVC